MSTVKVSQSEMNTCIEVYLWTDICRIELRFWSNSMNMISSIVYLEVTSRPGPSNSDVITSLIKAMLLISNRAAR